MDFAELWNATWKGLGESLLKQLVAPSGGIGVVADLPTFGESVSAQQEANAMRLRALCEEAVSNPIWAAHDITGDGIAETFCNRAARFIAQGMGFFGFRSDHSADQMLALMAADPAWREESDISRIEGLALRGALVMICLDDHPHGHIVAAAPEAAQDSSSWGQKVPIVAQVGTAKIGNGIKRLSAAFRLADRPRLRAFVLESSIA